MKTLNLVAALAVALPTASFGVSNRAAAQDMALTFDDLPAHNALPAGTTRLAVIARIAAALSEAGAPPSYGFINASSAGEAENARVLELWRASGNRFGNHTWSHINLAETSVETYIDQITRNEPVLATLSPDADWRWFRYPYLSEGETPEKRAAVREWLSAHHYKVASATLSFEDYAWNQPYARCADKRDLAGIAALEASYLAFARETLLSAREMSQALYGRQIPLVLLMHVGAFDAHMMPALLAMYREEGVRFVPLETAQADAFYAADLGSESSPSPLYLETAMTEKGLTPPERTPVFAALEVACR